MKNGFLILARWLTMLTLGLWLGGILFLGAVSAPGIFKFCRAHDVEALAPQLVGVLVARFAPVSLVFGALALLAMLAEVISMPVSAKRQATRRLLWRGQAIGVLAMLGVAFYLNFVALPQLLSDQEAVMRESAANGTTLSARGTEGKSATRLRFDALHQRYSSLTMIIFWLGAASLAAFAWRVSLPEKPLDMME